MLDVLSVRLAYVTKSFRKCYGQLRKHNASNPEQRWQTEEARRDKEFVKHDSLLPEGAATGELGTRMGRKASAPLSLSFLGIFCQIRLNLSFLPLFSNKESFLSSSSIQLKHIRNPSHSLDCILPTYKATPFLLPEDDIFSQWSFRLIYRYYITFSYLSQQAQTSINLITNNSNFWGEG